MPTFVIDKSGTPYRIDVASELPKGPNAGHYHGKDGVNLEEDALVADLIGYRRRLVSEGYVRLFEQGASGVEPVRDERVVDELTIAILNRIAGRA